MVSNMRFLQSSNPLAWLRRTLHQRSLRPITLRSWCEGCNLSAASGRAMAVTLFASLLAIPADAQDSAVPAAQPNEHATAVTVKFLGGGILALALHETGHLAFDAVFDAQPRIEAIHFGPFPFFAVTHRSGLLPREEFTISSAGFWMQEASDEWFLTRRWCGDTAAGCSFREDRAWLAKGMFTFNLLNSAGYALVAFAKAGPFERDTRGMADAIGVDERAIGVVILAPAVLDAYR